MWNLTRHEKLLVLWLCAAIVCGSLIRHYRHAVRFAETKPTAQTAPLAPPARSVKPSVVGEKDADNQPLENDDG